MKRGNGGPTDGPSKQLKLTSFLSVSRPRPSSTTNSVEIESGETGSSSRVDVSILTPPTRPTPVTGIGLRLGLAVEANESRPIPAPTITAASNKTRKFQNRWIEQMKWIHYDSNTNVATCNTCRSFPEISDQSSSIVRGFSGPFKIESFKKHEKSNQHARCCSALEGKLNFKSTPMARCILKADEKMINHLKVVFNCSYYLAKNNRPFSDLNELLVLTKKLDVDVLPEYNNRKACKEFVHHISAIVESDLIADIKNSSAVSLLLDGSTDISGDEQLILYARYLKGSKIEESFLSLLPLEHCTADGYLQALKKQLEILNLSDILSGNRLVGIGTDGASSMVGAQNGLVKKMSQLDGLGHLMGVHCVAHRLNLIVLSSIKNVKYLEEIDSVLVMLCKFYRKSPKRMRELQNVSKVLECELLKPQYLHTVRWVSSKVGALTALVKDWKCIAFHLEDIANKKDDEAATARGLLKKLKSFRFVITTHFLKDFLEVFSTLSLIFQKKDLLLSLVTCHVRRCLDSLETLKQGRGKMEDLVVSNTSLKGVFQEMQLQGLGESAQKLFSSDKEQMIETGIQFLNARFPTATDNLAHATSVFDTFSWPSTGNGLEQFGNKEVETLCSHFKNILGNDVDNENIMNEVMGEWYEFKVFGQKLPLQDLLDKVVSMCDRFPNLSKLLGVIAVLPTSTASCERGFSTMNLIKDKFRSMLQTESMNDLMMINMNGPNLVNFDPTKSVEHWYFETKGQRHVQGHRQATTNSATTSAVHPNSN